MQFLEPHGMHDEGLAGNADRFQALRELASKGAEPELRAARIALGGYVLTTTAPSDISDAGSRTRAELMAAYPYLLWMDTPEFPARVLEQAR